MKFCLSFEQIKHWANRYRFDRMLLNIVAKLSTFLNQPYHNLTIQFTKHQPGTLSHISINPSPQDAFNSNESLLCGETVHMVHLQQLTGLIQSHKQVKLHLLFFNFAKNRITDHTPKPPLLLRRDTRQSSPKLRLRWWWVCDCQRFLWFLWLVPSLAAASQCKIRQ